MIRNQIREVHTAAHRQARTGGSDLPACIERVARQLGAVYRPDQEQARYNLHADEHSVKAYLGTYLPRTVYEFTCIGHDMLGHAPMRRAIASNRPLSILDLGSGTGGAWMGLASALFSQGFRRGLEIDAIDGNQLALSKQAPFANAMQAQSGVPIQLVTTHCQLGADAGAFASSLYTVLKRLNKQYDFVLVSKHLSEFYCVKGRAACGVVYEALQWLEYALKPQGFLVMLDVTIRIDEMGEYFPNIMARELGEYMVSKPGGLRPVLPLPCAVSSARGCAASRGQCFTQRQMHFRQGMDGDGVVRRDVTKVTYRVLARQPHASSITAGYSCGLAYQVNAQRDDQACCHGQIVTQKNGVNGYFPVINRPQ